MMEFGRSTSRITCSLGLTSAPGDWKSWPPERHDVYLSNKCKLCPREKVSAISPGAQQILWLQASVLRNPREHPRSDLFAIMERPNGIRPTRTREHHMRATGSPLLDPSDSEKSAENAS